MEYNFIFDESTNTLRGEFTGRMDTIKSNEALEVFNRECEGLLNPGLPRNAIRICFDLKGVDYISSSFLRLCLIAAKAVREGNFSIINTSPDILKVFKITGLDTALNIS
jgi:anti-anti-sigma factor